MNRLSVVVIVVVLASCVNRKPVEPTPLVAAPVPLPPPPKTDHFHTSLVAFEGDEMVSCVDYVLDVSPVDAAYDHDLTKARFAKLIGEMTKNLDRKRVLDIPKLCPQQFADREPFARCRIAGDLAARGQFAIVESFYSFDNVFLSDETMKECLQMKGDWRAMSRTSDAFREAQLSHDMGAARKMVGKASRALE